MTDGLSIRPQLLHLSPQYRRLRDSILRPHLRLTESRYFWERWKARLGPDATVLIMEVRDRCNQALAATSRQPAPAATDAGPTVSDLANTTGDSGQGADGCTVSASELAAACGFSRVTLWRILQREDVRRFISVEHNYVYDRRLGKKRRTVSTYRVQMEDPLLEEDEARLQQLLALQGTAEATPAAGMAVGRGAPRSPRPTLQNETEVVDNRRPRLHAETTHGESIPKPRNVQGTIVQERLGADGRTSPPTPARPLAGLSERAGSSPAASTPPGAHLPPGEEIDIWRKYPEIAHFVEEAETFLGDRHSRAFYVKALRRLYPGYMDVWQRALGLAREQQHIRRSRGALFTRLLRTFAAEAGLTL
ncbi:MAG TPA: hypothetical protein VHS99_15270 [Chloroflexota bacterium]|nr:hypothetical protein [Chloroflexota bacterium]